MKTMKFFVVLVLGIVTAVCVSCNKDDEEIPQVIDSTIQDSGMDANVTVAPSSAGTDFTYKSWVVVDQVFSTRSAVSGETSKVATRASGSGTEISVLLTNSLKHVIDTVKVDHFKFIQSPTPVIETKVGDSYPEGNWITITDNILMYKLDYGTFVEKYELLYQTATYNDGVNRFTLPHKDYGDYSLGEWKTATVDAKREDDGVAYAVKLFTQPLSVNFEGRMYVIDATYRLNRPIETNGNAFIVKSEVLEKSIQPIGTDGEAGQEFTSKLKVRQTWSDGRNETNEYPISLSCEMSSEIRELSFVGDPNDRILARKEVIMTDDSDSWSVPNNPEFGGTTYDKTGELRLFYPSWQVEIRLRESHAFYDDGSTYDLFDGPVFKAENVTIVSDNLTPMAEAGWYHHNVVVEVEVCGAKLKYEAYNVLHFR